MDKWLDSLLKLCDHFVYCSPSTLVHVQLLRSMKKGVQVSENGPTVDCYYNT